MMYNLGSGNRISRPAPLIDLTLKYNGYKLLTQSCWRLMVISLLSLGFYYTVSTANAKRPESKKIQRLPASSPLKLLTLPALSSTDQEVLNQVRSDPPPTEIVRNSHYWVSNEHNHQLWYPNIDGVGGALVGVGTDQNYLLAGWARSSIVVLMDFDSKIPVIHEIYNYMFSISATPDEFLKRWSRKYSHDSAEKLAAHFTSVVQPQAEDEAQAKNLNKVKTSRYVKWRVRQLVKERVHIYKITRGLLWRRLDKTKKKYRELKIPTFLSNQVQYDHIRSLWAGGRILAIRGDLTADYTMVDIAKALTDLGESLNVLYLSNAEQYFKLPPTYRRNIIAQPWGERGVALRTMGWRSLGFFDEDEKYHYNVQSGANFVAWMRQSRTTKAGRMMFKGRKIQETGFSIMTGLPTKSKRLPKIAPMPK